MATETPQLTGVKAGMLANGASKSDFQGKGRICMFLLVRSRYRSFI